MPGTTGAKKPYAPYGSDQIDINKDGYATPKPYPIASKKGVNPKTGARTITLRDTGTGKDVYSGDDAGGAGRKDFKGRALPIGASVSSRNTSDSIAQQRKAKEQAGYYNIGKKASMQEKGGTFKPKVTVRGKVVGHNRIDTVETGGDCGCGSKMQTGGAFFPPQGQRMGAIQSAQQSVAGTANDYARQAHAAKLANLRKVADSVGTNRAYPGGVAPANPVPPASGSKFVSPVSVTPLPAAAKTTTVKKVYPGFNAGGNRGDIY